MPWEQRLAEAAYTGVDGVRHEFEFVDVQRSVDRRVKAFKSPGLDGAFMQDNGNDALVLPMVLFISGADYDLAADALFDSLIARGGFGILEHPRYGRRVVIAGGTVKQDDKLVTQTNQAAITVTFFETLEEIYPTEQIDSSNEALKVADLTAATQAEDFETTVEAADTVTVEIIKERLRVSLPKVSDALRGLSEQVAEAESAFNDIYDSISLGLNQFILTPLALAFQVHNLFRTVVNTGELLSDRLDGYSNLLDSLIGNDADASVTTSVGSNTSGNESSVLFARSAVISSIVATTAGGVDTRQDAIRQAQKLGEMHDLVVSWSETNNVQGNGTAARQLLTAVSHAQVTLLRAGSLLPVELSFFLERPRNPIELLRELYNRDDVDDVLNQFITDNGLGGDTIMLIPAGTTVVYRG